LSKVQPQHLERDSIADWSVRGKFYQPSCFFASWAWQKAGQLDESLRYALDLDLWLRLAAAGPFVAIPTAISVAKIHGNAKTQAERSGMHLETLMTQLKYGYRAAAERRLAYLIKHPVLVYQRLSVLKSRLERFLLSTVLRKEAQRFQDLRVSRR
jgi:GT2 family glycosyltransferase